MNYVIITSAYNEGKYIERTIHSVIKQTVLPSQWVIVDDGSKDDTYDLIAKYAKEYSWIKPIKKEHEDFNFGEHAVKLFYFGKDHLSTNSYKYIVKLDADIEIDSEKYFEYQIEKMEFDSKLGITSGITYSIENNVKVLTKNRPYWHTGGALKFYRMDCLESIGGLDPIFGWDGLDEYKAMHKGWKTRTFFNLHANHLAKQRAKTREATIWLSYNKGLSLYRRGYPIEFVLARYFFLIGKFRFKNGNAFLKGYIKSWLSKEKRYVTDDQLKFNRKFQYMRVLDKLIINKQIL